MADEPNNDAAGADQQVTKPEGLPDSYWNAEANAPNFESITKDLSEVPALRDFKAAKDAAEAAIPKPEEYKFDLPEGVQVPEGMKWEVDLTDPLAKGILEVAAKHRWTQDQLSSVVALWAGHQAKAMEADRAAVAEETKALGEKAEDRRNAVSTFLSANLGKDHVEALKPLLDYRVGVEAFEALMEKVKGQQIAGLPSGAKPNPNAALAEKVGKVPAMELFNAA